MTTLNETTPYVCLTCGETFVGFGNNPDPIGYRMDWVASPDAVALIEGAHAEVEDRRVCNDCNSMYVLPLRLGMAASGSLYDREGNLLGSFGVRK